MIEITLKKDANDTVVIRGTGLSNFKFIGNSSSDSYENAKKIGTKQIVDKDTVYTTL